jgi:hypothetical protein
VIFFREDGGHLGADSKLPGLIQAALAAINARLEQMRLDHGGTLEEEEAIADALSGIRVLQKEINEA